MIEIPEALTLATQIQDTVVGKRIMKVVAGSSPHGFAWYFGEPEDYPARLENLEISGVFAHGGKVELEAEHMRIALGEGVRIRLYQPGEKYPAKHQLFIEFDDESTLVCTVQMYGCLLAFPEGANDDFYYVVGKQKPAVLSEDFDLAYFRSLVDDEVLKGSAKAFLATQQRIPGLGNGVVQDILWQAGVHPKRKMGTVDGDSIDTLFATVKRILAEMTDAGGRCTEKDLFGNPGGYQVIMCNDGLGNPCPRCGSAITTMSYLGGKVYVCTGCQKLT
ncbi:MAG: hypothetical protein LBG99_07985 [Propionibacteriaceae bacterium]|jgi:formamidopyrimidine-DNA glycosylase|nr:hypothetical protein [Propionibacteriaceae bacterium]